MVSAKPVYLSTQGTTQVIPFTLLCVFFFLVALTINLQCGYAFGLNLDVSMS